MDYGSPVIPLAKAKFHGKSKLVELVGFGNAAYLPTSLWGFGTDPAKNNVHIHHLKKQNKI